MRIFVLAITITTFVSSVLVGNALNQLSLDELRRRARFGHDRRLYRLASFGRSAKFALGAIAAISFTIFVTEMRQEWQVILASLAAMWAIIGYTDRPNPTGRGWRLADILSGP